MTTKILTLLFALTIIANGANERFADHLEPEFGPFVNGRLPRDLSETIVQTVLTTSASTTMGVLLIMDDRIAIVTFGTDGGGANLAYEVECPFPGNPNEKSVVTRPVERTCFEKLRRIWLAELSKVSYAKNHRIVSGGIRYHFFLFANGNNYSGYAASVQYQSKLPSLSNLLSLATLLCAYVKSNDASAPEIMKDIKKRIVTQLHLEERRHRSR